MNNFNTVVQSPWREKYRWRGLIRFFFCSLSVCFCFFFLMQNEKKKGKRERKKCLSRKIFQRFHGRREMQTPSMRRRLQAECVTECFARLAKYSKLFAILSLVSQRKIRRIELFDFVFKTRM